jgi:hypothetical protein
MRFEFSALPWELLGARPAMVTLTYPGDWELYVPNARELVRHREAFKERWRKKFGAPIGVWVVEFQERGAPHLHLYVGLPDAASHEDYAELQSRTMLRKRREHDVGPFEARRTTPPVAGEFGEWLRTAWWEIVGSGLPAHHKRGVDVAVAFFSDRAETSADRLKVADYFWRESGKWAQKQPPEGFGPLKFYGRWGGGDRGFNPIVSVAELHEMIGLEVRRMLRRLRRSKERQAAEKTGRRVKRTRGPRGRDGLKVFGVDGTRLGPLLIDCAERIVVDKMSAVLVVGSSHRHGSLWWRAASEFEIGEEPGDDFPWDMKGALEEPERHGPGSDFEIELEEYEERRAEDEADLDAAVEAEVERRRRIDAVRAANGLPPKKHPKRLNVVMPNAAGREGKAR